MQHCRDPLAMTVAVAFLAASTVQAHDFWIQPSVFKVVSGQTVTLRLLIGEPDAAEHWETEWRKIVSLQDFGPKAVSDELAALRPVQSGAPALYQADAVLTLSEQGTHMLAFTSNQQVSELPGDQFTRYALHEGLTLPLAARKAKRTILSSGRDCIRDAPRPLVQVGNQPSDTISSPTGQTLEIVPDRNPYLLKSGEPLRVVVWFHGEPLPGASVVMERLAAAGAHEPPLVTDSRGRVSWPLPSSGDWKINVVWSYPIREEQADYETIFCSLTFGIR